MPSRDDTQVQTRGSSGGRYCVGESRDENRAATLVRRWRGDIDRIEELETLLRQGPVAPEGC
jgi:hypothetical protein